MGALDAHQRIELVEVIPDGPQTDLGFVGDALKAQGPLDDQDRDYGGNFWHGAGREPSTLGDRGGASLAGQRSRWRAMWRWIARWTGDRGAIASASWSASATRSLHFLRTVEMGYSRACVAELTQRAASLTRPGSPFLDSPSRRGVTWLTPTLKAEVTFSEIVAGRLRAAVWRGLLTR